jgi:hypothetical protein
MTTAEERLQILNMIKEGKISSDEGVRLLQALQSGAGKQGTPGREARWLRVKVTDLRNGQVKFNINLPIGLVKVGVRLGAQFGTGDLSIDNVRVMDAIRNGEMGKITEIQNESENERIEIWLE